jgi:hypothetical protein
LRINFTALALRACEEKRDVLSLFRGGPGVGTSFIFWFQKSQGLLHFERAIYDFVNLRLRLMLSRGFSYPQHFRPSDYHAPMPDVWGITSND